VGAATDQAHAQVVATRQRLEGTLDRLEERLRRDLDPRYRLRRDGPRIAAAGVALLVVGMAVWARRRRHQAGEPEQDWIAAMPEDWRRRLEELLAEAATKGHVTAPVGSERRHRSQPLWQKAGLRLGRMAAPVVLNAAAERWAGRRDGGG
jgi:hypothetical protein